MPGQGANDAAYMTAMLVEQCVLKKEEYTGGAADIHKCFDQIQRPLMYEILRDGGMPEKVLSVYKKFLAKTGSKKHASWRHWDSIQKANRYPTGGTLSR